MEHKAPQILEIFSLENNVRAVRTGNFPALVGKKKPLFS